MSSGTCMHRLSVPKIRFCERLALEAFLVLGPKNFGH